jgi:hypothetical protein
VTDHAPFDRVRKARIRAGLTRVGHVINALLLPFINGISQIDEKSQTTDKDTTDHDQKREKWL